MTIENLGNLTIRINGPEEEEYPHDNFSLDRIPYDGAVSAHFITKINFDLSAELVDNKSPYALIIHNSELGPSTRTLDSFVATLPSDGYYEITTLIFPTTTYIELGLGYLPGSKIIDNLRTNIIAAEINGDNVIFKILTHTRNEEDGYYQYMWSGWQDITLEDILLMMDKIEQSSPNEFSVKKITKSVFVYDNIYKCYINKANDLLNKYTGDPDVCGNGTLCDDELNKYKVEIKTRDYLWAAINVIKYCIDNCWYLKALRVLNCVSSCGGLCKDTISKNAKVTKGCGCNK